MEQAEVGRCHLFRTLADEGIEVFRDIDPGASYENDLRYLIIITIISIIIIVISMLSSDALKNAHSDGAVKSASIKKNETRVPPELWDSGN